MAKQFLEDPKWEGVLFRRRILVASVFVAVAIIGIVFRLYILQYIDHEKYVEKSRVNYQRVVPIPPTRGQIFDRHGVLLADNRAQFVLEVVPDQLEDANGDGRRNRKDLEILLDRLSQVVNVSEKELKKFWKFYQRDAYNKYKPIPLKLPISPDDLARFVVNQVRFPGVQYQRRMQRVYPLGDVAGHVIGYVGRIDKNDLKKVDQEDYGGNTHIGKTGIEAYHEERLHGTSGRRVIEVDALGRHQRDLSKTEAISGDDLILSLDINLQIRAEELLQGERGVIVVLVPATGEVLAMASQPSFDINLFVDGISHKDYSQLRDNPDRPLYNRAIQGAYPPGSTVKPMLSLAGLAEGVITAKSKVWDGGFFTIVGHKHRYRCWHKGGHGHVNLNLAIAQSCDTYFYDLAYRMGIDRLSRFMSKFGFGVETGVDLPAENDGNMPTPSWKKRRHKTSWYPGDTVNVGIGQGYWLATPLQLATATSIVANRGKRMRPQMLKSYRNIDGVEKQVLPEEMPGGDLDLNPLYWQEVIRAMANVMHAPYGTAKASGLNARYDIAGKTGTAQVFNIAQNARYDASKLDKRLHDHSLFVGFAPIFPPEIAISVVVENGGGGSAVAAPIARQMMDAYFDMKKVSAKKAAVSVLDAQ